MKRSLPFCHLVILMLFTLGCQDQHALAELEEMKAQVEVEKQNIAMCERLFEELDEGNAEFVREFFAPDAKSYTPSGSAVPASREELLDRTRTFLHGFPDLHHTVEDVIAEGDKVTIRFTARGTHQGDFGGIPATGNGMELSVISIMRFEDGKVIEQRQETDALGMMQQLGRL